MLKYFYKRSDSNWKRSESRRTCKEEERWQRRFGHATTWACSSHGEKPFDKSKFLDFKLKFSCYQILFNSKLKRAIMIRRTHRLLKKKAKINQPKRRKNLRMNQKKPQWMVFDKKKIGTKVELIIILYKLRRTWYTQRAFGYICDWPSRIRTSRIDNSLRSVSDTTTVQENQTMGHHSKFVFCFLYLNFLIWKIFILIECRGFC